MIDVKMLNWDELAALQDQIKHEMKLREQEKFQKLAQNAADALNALKDAYPYVSLYVDGYSGCDEYYDTNVFDHFDHFTAKDFIK